MGQFFRLGNNIYNMAQVARVEAVGGGNADITFTDGFVLTVTIAEAKDIFGGVI